MKKLSYSALNIVSHPHSPENYINMFFDLKKTDLAIKLRGDTYATVVHINRQDKSIKDGPILGEIVKYTHIDKDADWYDITSQEVATEKDLLKIKSLPDHLKPNMSRFSFIFYPDCHLMIFESLYEGQGFSPNYAQKLFDSIFNSPKFTDKYGDVNVTVVPETDAIDNVLSLSGIKYLRMVTSMPNPDTLKKAEEKVKKRLSKINAISEERILKSTREQELLLDEITKLEAKVAAKNGEVNLKRYNESGKKEEFNTKEHALVEDNFYDPAVSSTYDELIRIAENIKKRVLEWI
ncbi:MULTISPECIES: DUF4747 family protein [Vibrio]|uniref:DUF4747 family protein n=1 Tax=Vibrio TaxID=662 RepID=UPI002074F22F|nr:MULTISPECIES: DUF4747 family protein [Vibrio]USD33956.1 DUF4747 family protein [Vibrio sp. SCSIO 43186]USD44226.1 DUF4747 family protein [Vibrio sp. SCSIO 43145]USD71080.1 DUF4747 family protein [Vibrio sp. SCSIO 43139]USD95986.1 DUF4747 domain-containing protein [Vibrio coralliilyticus]